MTPSVVAAAIALVLALYLLITDWVDLAPWNNVGDLPRRQKLLLSLTNYTPLVLLAFFVLQQDPILVSLAVVIASVDLLLHLMYWWLPYLRGASAAQTAEHANLFGGTTTFLPRIGDHPIPNAQHVVVGILMVLMWAASLAAAAAVFSS